MHAIPSQDSAAIEAEELSRLAPTPHVPELSGDRQRALRRFLMNEIDFSTPAVAPATVRRRPRSRLAAAAAVGIVAVGAVAAVAVLTRSGTGSGSASHPASSAALVAVQPASATPVGPVLAKIAYVAARQPALAPRPEQFVYVKSLVAFTHPAAEQTLGGTRVLGPLHQREVWLAQKKTAAPAGQSQTGVIVDGKPQQLLVTGYIRENGKTSPIYSTDLGTTYATLAALPADPAALLQKIHALTKGQADPAAAAFDYIGELLREQIAPPTVSAALYRAAALIPGVVIVPDVVDAAGRHGFGVARVAGGERFEWIFDKTSMQYLGERDYLVRDTSGGKAGMLTGTTAVLSRGVVDKPGELPAASASPRALGA